MTDEEKRVADLIRAAFHYVRLGNGVGLRQGQALDDYEDEATEAQYRAEDEKEAWSKISADDLNRYGSSLSFFDAEGMRFHLPAYLIADLAGTLDHDIVFYLTYSEHDAMSRFDLLSESQRHAVREFLMLFAATCSADGVTFVALPELRQTIEKVLAEYWTD
jgi:hypothetical protein